jgi:hypothetical protein
VHHGLTFGCDCSGHVQVLISVGAYVDTVAVYAWLFDHCGESDEVAGKSSETLGTKFVDCARSSRDGGHQRWAEERAT